jgi:hypothetical protein
LIVGEKIQYFPTYLPIGHIAESERGNKQYFNLGLIVVGLTLPGFQLTTIHGGSVVGLLIRDRGVVISSSAQTGHIKQNV